MTVKTWGPVQFIAGPNSGKYPYCHSLYIQGERKVIIDPASDREQLQALLEGPGVDLVWLSHVHEDHFMHLDLFDDQELWVGAPDAPALGDLEVFLDFYGVLGESERGFWKEIMVKQFNYRPRTVTKTFVDGEVIDLGGVTVEVMATPGHTQGHFSFYFREPELLFLGDYDLTRFGPWYGDRFSDLDLTIASVNRLRQCPARVWVAAHEQGVFETEPGPLWDQYLGAIDEREAKLLALLEQPRTMEEIIEARILYKKKREPKEFYDFGERGHMIKHLERLMNQGRVALDGETYRLI
jgi:glyoxylase-like metal-dependent hydrolase (beta-lactamase superfamily II)